jgi:hypothetical protein
MGFINRGFETPVYTEQSKEPERVIIISCEGSNTEPEYFETIKEKLSDYIPVILEIKIVPKPSNASEPKDVVCNLEKYILDQYDYKSDYDEMWVIWDREKVEPRKINILKMLPECKAKNYNIAITNPLFEFWLLLHVVNISNYDNKTLYDNVQVNATRKFIDKELSDVLANGYNKKKDKFNKDIVTKDNILKALEQEKLFENELEKIIDTLGSNVGDLINKILKF